MLVRAACLLLFVPASALAQAPGPAPVADTARGLVKVPALTLVPLHMVEAVSSEHRKRGETFHFAVDEDVRIGGRIVIPRGSPGLGEVVFASDSSTHQHGELVLAARYVTVGDRQVRLRSFFGGAQGRWNDALAVYPDAGSTGRQMTGRPKILGRNGLAGASTAEDVE